MTLREPYSHKELLPLVAPRTVALIGASARPESLAAKVRTSLLSGSVAESTFLVNPRYETIGDERCYSSMADVPQPIDCAIIAVSVDGVVPALEECVAVGVGSALILASGFAEIGTPEGLSLQQRITEISAESGIRVCGPNTIGLANIRDGIESLFMPAFGADRVAGSIGLVVQSGAMAYHLLQAQRRGIGFSYGLMPGNSCDVDVVDFVNFLVEDDSTRVIALVFEGLGRDAGAGRRLQQVASRARAAGKPIVALRGGAGEASRAAALSHTGGMTGSARAYEVAFETMGIIEVGDLDELVETAAFLAVAGTARASGANIVSLSGGAGVLSAGAAETASVSLPALSPAAATALEAFVPSYGSIANPLDLTATVGMSDGDALTQSIEVVAADEKYGVIVVPQTVALESVTTPRCTALREVAHRIDIPLVVIWMSEWLEGPGSSIIESDDRASLFRSARRAFAAIHSWLQWSQWLTTDEPMDELVSDAETVVKVRAVVDAALATSVHRTDRFVLDELASRSLLSMVGIGGSIPVAADSVAAAVDAADRIGYPVVLKVLSQEIVHKSRIGGVALNIVDADAVRRAFESIRNSVAEAGYSIDAFEVLVEPVVVHDTELIVGGRYDHDFGSVVMVGRGGTDVEEVDESILDIGPVGPHKAQAMVDALGSDLLGGHDDAVAAAIVAVAALLDADNRIDEIDVNPLVITTDGVVALDGVVVLRPNR